MRTIRLESFVVARQKKLGIVLLGLLATCVTSFTGAAVIQQYSLCLLLFGSLTVTLVAPIARRWVNVSLGVRGERVIEKLLCRLDDRYLLVSNWTPSIGPPTGDIDLLLLGPHGALVIEVKSYSVPVKVDGEKWWVQTQGQRWKPIRSLSHQLRQNVMTISARSPARTTGVLVFNRKASINISNPTVTIFRAPELLPWIQGLPLYSVDADELWDKISHETELAG